MTAGHKHDDLANDDLHVPKVHGNDSHEGDGFADENHTHVELHEHTNLPTLGKITESGGKMLFDGEEVDGDSFHKSVDGEIAALPEKAALVAADSILVEDSLNGNSKAQVKAENLPNSTADVMKKVNYAITATTTIDVDPVPAYVHHLVDCTAGQVVMTIPDATPGAGQWFAFTQIRDGNHVKITTAGGTQIIGAGTATFAGVFTCGSSLILTTNDAGDGYDVIVDTRIYSRIVDITEDIDFTGSGFESGALYLCAPPVGVTLEVTLPLNTASHRGIHAKFKLVQGVGGYGQLLIQEATSGYDEEIVKPEASIEVTDDGTRYHTTQDSRGGANAITLFQYATTAAHPSIGGYLLTVTSQDEPEYDTVAVDATLGTVTGPDISLVKFASQPGVIRGTTGETVVFSLGNIRKTSAAHADAIVYVKTFHRTAGGVETQIALSNNTQVIDGAIYVTFDVSALIAAGFDFTATEFLVTEVLSTKVGGGTNPTLEMQVGGDTPAYTSLAIPATSFAHDNLSGRASASTPGTGENSGHLGHDQFLAIVQDNLLINSNLKDPVDQEGNLPVTNATSGQYQLDGWELSDDVSGQVDIAVQSGGGTRATITSYASGTFMSIRQKVSNYLQYAGKTITLSARIKTNSTTFRLRIAEATNTYSVYHTGGGDWETLTVSVTVGASPAELIMLMYLASPSASDYFECLWIKLEEGSVNTPYRIDDNCFVESPQILKRFERLTFEAGTRLGAAIAENTTTLYIFIPHSNKLEVSGHTVEASSLTMDAYLFEGGGSISLSGVLWARGTRGTTLKLTGVGLVSGKEYSILASGFIDIDATNSL